jgi:hypothetical protein
MFPMTRIGATPKPHYKRGNKTAKAAPVESRIITVTTPSKRVRSSDDADVDVPEGVKKVLQADDAATITFVGHDMPAGRYIGASKQVHAEGSPQ